MSFYPILKKKIFRLFSIGILIIYSTNIHKVDAIDLSNLNHIKDEKYYEKEIVRLKINESLLAENIVVLRKNESEWYFPKSNLIKNRIDVSDLPYIEYDSEYYLSLSILDGTNITYDKSKQELIVTIKSKYFLKNELSIINKTINKTEYNKNGSFINYDFSFDTSSSTRTGAAITELGKTFNFGVATSNFAYVESIENSRFIRLDTTLTIDLINEISTVRIGDSISQPATILGRPLRFGGIQYSSNFQIQPQYIKVPTAFLSSQAALPSTVDIFVNNTLQTRKEIPPGPFSISGVPLISGDGEVKMIITDLAGRQQIISQNFYSSPTLLAKNVREFSFEAGALRTNFSQENNEYSNIFTSGSYRYGLTNNLTIEGGLQIQQGGKIGLQTSATNTINKIGLISAAAAYSKTNYESGRKLALGLQRNTDNYSIGINTQIAEQGYSQEGIEIIFNTKKVDTFNFSYRIKNLGSIGMGIVKQELMSGSKTEIFTSNFSTSQKSWGSLMFSAFTSNSNTKNYGINIFWILPFEQNLSGSLSYSQNRSHITREQTVLQLQRNMPSTYGIGYRLQTGINVPSQAGISAQNQYMFSRLEAAEFEGNSSLRFAISGALANFENQWFLTRRINESFGLVKIPGMSNVRVYVDNQLAAKTNKDGMAFLPRLSAYQQNRVSIEPEDLPIDSEIDTLSMRPVPAWRSGVNIDFPIRRSAAASMNFVDEEGAPIPAGAVAIVNDDNTEYPIGSDGEAYLSRLKKINHVKIIWERKQCTVIIPFNQQEGNVIYLGEFLCKN